MDILAAILAFVLGATSTGHKIAALTSWNDVYAWVAEPGPHCIRVRQTGVAGDTMSWVEDLRIGGQWITEWVGSDWSANQPIPVDAIPGRADLPLGPTGMMIGWERVGAGIVVQVIPYALDDCPRPMFARSMLASVRR